MEKEKTMEHRPETPAPVPSAPLDPEPVPTNPGGDGPVDY